MRGASMWGANISSLTISIKIGNKYYNGTTWVESAVPVLIDVKCNTESDVNALGAVRNTVTMQMPYSGANGFIIPVDQYLEGKMELTFYSIIVGSASVTHSGSAAAYLNELNISYYSGDEKNNEMRLTRLTDKKFQSDLELLLNLSSSVDHRISQSLLWFGGSPVGASSDLEYVGEVELTQPEYWLMDTLLMLYTNPSEELVLEVGYDSTLKVYDIVHIDGKDYVITGRETNFKAEHVKLYLTSYE